MVKYVLVIVDRLQEKPSDPDVFRLLGEVKYQLKDYDGSAAAYRASTMVSIPLVHMAPYLSLAASGDCLD